MKAKSRASRLLTRRRLVKGVLWIVVLACIGSAGYLGFTVFDQIKNFDIKNLTTSATSQQVDANGTAYYTYGSAQGKYWSYDDIPEVMIDAVVSAEDSRFFVHDGFDLPRIVKALIQNILARRTVAGGSTITQQLIKKTYYPDEEKTIQRKIGEAILSVEATKQTSKKKIMELYLNKIYFGRSPSTIGLSAACRYYFNKKPNQLTLPEAAMLAGTINSPVYYDPFYSHENAQYRRDVVLKLMQQHGYITEDVKEATEAVDVANFLESNPITATKKYAAYTDTVTAEVEELTGYDPTTTNMTIYTYLDTDVQTSLEAIASGETYTFSDSDIQVGSVVQETTTGRIIGILGARGYNDTTYLNYATTVHNQPGSSIKPILDYGTCFEYLYWSNGHIIDDASYSAGGWTPKNWDSKVHGNVTLYNAMGNSWNLAAINAFNQAIDEKGKKGLIKWMLKLGYDDEAFDTSDTSKFNVAYAIGGWYNGVTPLQQTAAYSAISNGGTYITPHTIRKVVINTTGETIYIDKECRAKSVQAMSDSTAFMLRDIMTTIVKDYSSYSAVNIGDEIGAKTGTTNWGKNSYGIPSGSNRDYWLCCFSPDYAWSCWCGFPDDVLQSKGKYPTSKNNESKKICGQIAELLHERGMENSYETPDSVVKCKYIKGVYPYEAPTSSTPSSRIGTAYFVKGHLPSGTTSTEDDDDDEDDAPDLNTLDSFTASVTDSNKFKVTFTAYDPSSKTTTATGDYGRVVYRVRIVKGNSTVKTLSLHDASATLDFTPDYSSTYTLIGYYAWENASKTSNKISQTVKTKSASVGTATFSVTSGGNALSSGGTMTSTGITVKTSGPSGNKMILTLSGGTSSSQTVTCGKSAKFKNLPSDSSFTLTVQETNGSDTTTIGSITFKSKAEESSESTTTDDNTNESTTETNESTDTNDSTTTEGGTTTESTTTN